MDVDRVITFRVPGGEMAATAVAYEVCSYCGFRLMRVESTIIQDRHLRNRKCPICGYYTGEEGLRPGLYLSREEKCAAFEAWLGQHGLNRATLMELYRLDFESFFLE
jgi:ribosomal protein L32